MTSSAHGTSGVLLALAATVAVMTLHHRRRQQWIQEGREESDRLWQSGSFRLQTVAASDNGPQKRTQPDESPSVCDLVVVVNEDKSNVSSLEESSLDESLYQSPHEHRRAPTEEQALDEDKDGQESKNNKNEQACFLSRHTNGFDKPETINYDEGRSTRTGTTRDDSTIEHGDALSALDASLPFQRRPVFVSECVFI